MEKITCKLCFHKCKLGEGQSGFCTARKNIAGKIVPINYGKITAIALDPIEKKPLYHFYPGSRILSIGSFACNFKCPFCQNAEISIGYSKISNSHIVYTLASGQNIKIPFKEMSPIDLLNLSKKYVSRGNIGLAYTYNEALVAYEFVRDTAKLIHQAGLKNVLVTNASISLDALEEVLPYIDAMNIDLKSFSETFYRDFIKGDLNAVKAFIRRASEVCHIEITSLIIPGKNDSSEEMEEIASFIASLKNGKKIPLHISRFFPAYMLSDLPPTPLKSLYTLAEIAKRKLEYVYLGNI